MPITLPGTVNGTNLDASTDDPKLARADLSDHVTKFNALLGYVNALGIMDIGDGLENDAQGTAVKDKLRVKLNGTAMVSGLDRSASGLRIGTNAVALSMLARGTTSGNVLTDMGTAGDWQSQPVSVVSTPAGALVAYAGITAPSGWLFCDGSAVSRATYSALWAAIQKNATVTMTIASPAVVSWTSHGLLDDDAFVFSTTGALPTGFTAGTTYFVKLVNANSFQLAATRGGSAINSSGSQSGTHTGWHAPFGVGDNSTTFTLPDMRGRVAAGKDNMNGSTAQNRITAAGSGVYGKNVGAAGGAETHTLTTAQIPSHTHSLNNAVVAGSAGVEPTSGGNDFGRQTATGSAGSDGAHNNTQPTIVANYIIKT